jgi:hypothetical protein
MKRAVLSLRVSTNGVASFERQAVNGCTYLMMKSWVLMGPRLTLEGAASYK